MITCFQIVMNMCRMTFTDINLIPRKEGLSNVEGSINGGLGLIEGRKERGRSR
jgi:hypothetical protein